MLSAIKPTHFIQNFFIDPQYHIARHISIILLFAIIAINNGISIINYENENLNIYHIIFYTIALFAKYMCTLYVALYFLVPRFLLNKKYGTFFFLSSLWVFLMTIVEIGLGYVITSFLNIPLTEITLIDYRIVVILDTLSIFFMQMTIYIGVFISIFLKQWLKDTQRAAQIENQQIKTRLNELKEQLNPDFLFKTLQRISQLEKVDTNKASEMMLKLSQLLRYQLYECKREKVFLSSEIQFITNYLNLEKLYDPDFNYQLIIPPQPPLIQVPPLLFIPLIQEIVDQNTQQQIKQPLEINFLWNEEQLIFTTNSYKNGIKTRPKYLSTKQRLELLYGKNYNFQERTTNENKNYNIHLQIAI